MDRNTIIDQLRDLGLDAFAFKPNSGFLADGIDLLIIDLVAPEALIALKNYTNKSICFAPVAEKKLIEKAKLMGCERVYGFKEFFEEILPKL